MNEISGASRIVRAIIDSRVVSNNFYYYYVDSFSFFQPIIGHNCFLDLLYFHQHMISDLPGEW